MPPKELITLVNGIPNPVWFSERGQADAVKFLSLAARHGLDTDGAFDVLDLGCGCGRIARWVAPGVTAKGGMFYGSDINSRLVNWCSDHLPGRYLRNQLTPPLRLPSASIDLIYANSVLTHLTETSTVAWLHEISRILRSGGRALLTFHDESFAEKYGPSEIVARMKNEPYVVWNNAVEGSNYMSAWTTRAYFSRMAAPLFDVLEILPGGLDGPDQAVAVLANR